jgi:hypothetical protein
MRLTLTIHCDNAAFDDHPEMEIARILRKAAQDIDRGTFAAPLLDSNGNTVGKLKITGQR